MFKNYIFDLYGTLIDIRTDESGDEFWDKVADIYKSYGATYTAKEMNLDRTMIKSNTYEAYETLAPIDQLCNRFKFFIDKHRGFKKDILQDYINLFIFIDNEMHNENDLYLVTIKLLKLILECKKSGL